MSLMHLNISPVDVFTANNAFYFITLFLTSYFMTHDFCSNVLSHIHLNIIITQENLLHGITRIKRDNG